MDLINHVLNYFIFFLDKELSFQHGYDSGLSSSPSTPGEEVATQLVDFEKGLHSNFCGSTLNTCLFDGELPSKLYTHIKIKEEYDDEPWQHDAALPGQQDISLSAEFFGEQLELMDDFILGLSLNPRVDDERTEKPSRQIENYSTTSAEVTADPATCTNISTNISTNTSEETTAAVDCSPQDFEQNPFKRKLRARRRVSTVDVADHNYLKSSDAEAAIKNEFEDIEVNEQIEETEDDDEDFKPLCSVKKSRRTTKSNSAAKDSKYWERRKRNNLAAKRSREAKRARDMEISKKTSALEKENANLKKQVQKLKAAVKNAEKRLRAMV